MNARPLTRCRVGLDSTDPRDRLATGRRALPDLTRVVLRPVRGHHAFEACVEQLATAIRLGVYPHGTTLPPERELAERLHVSRATLREAMAALRTAGLVETRRGRGGGTVVTYAPRAPRARSTAPPPPTSSRAGWTRSTFRRIVEPGAVPPQRRCRSPGRDGASWLDRRPRRRSIVRVGTGVATGRPTRRFHLAVASLTGSPAIIEAVTPVQATLHDMLLRDPGATTSTSPTPTASTTASWTRSSTAGRSAPARPWKSTATTRPPSSAACSGDREPRTRRTMPAQRPLPDPRRPRAEDRAGDIDTVVVAFTDMQGRLQGKRLHGRYFLDVVRRSTAPRGATTCSRSTST